MIGALCLMYMDSFTFLLCQLDSQVSILVFFNDTECPVARQWSPTPVGLSRFVCSLNLWLSVLLVSPSFVYVAAVDVTRDVMVGSTLVFFGCFVFRVYYHRAAGVRRLVVHVYVM